MKKTIVLLLVLIMVFSTFTSLAEGEVNPLDIMIFKTGLKSRIELMSSSGFQILDKTYMDLVEVIDSDKLYLVIGEKSSQLQLEDGSLVYDLRNNEELIASLKGETITVNKNAYRGAIFPLKTDGYYLINHVELEDYLYGVVPLEMSVSNPKEALKAQVLAARSFALSNKEKHKKQGFNLCNTTHCQVYGGYDKENLNTNKLIDQTRGECVYYNGDIASTIFHSGNGGYMESAKGAWGADLPHLQSGKDDYSSSESWEFTISLSELTKKLNSAGIRLGKIEDIYIKELTDGNRVANLIIRGSDKEETISGSRLRTILGLRSSYFEIKGKEGPIATEKEEIEEEKNQALMVMTKSGKAYTNSDLYAQSSSEISIVKAAPYVVGEAGLRRLNYLSGFSRIEASYENINSSGKLSGDSITFIGRGYGHGVGMSQNGAKKMAESGYNYKDILKYYYKDIEIY